MVDSNITRQKKPIVICLNLDQRITVEPGEYKYVFDCNIPDECHTSVEETHGFIRYSVTVVIEEDSERKKEFVESFTVINPLNLNDDVVHSVR